MTASERRKISLIILLKENEKKNPSKRQEIFFSSTLPNTPRSNFFS